MPTDTKNPSTVQMPLPDVPEEGASNTNVPAVVSGTDQDDDLGLSNLSSVTPDQISAVQMGAEDKKKRISRQTIRENITAERLLADIGSSAKNDSDSFSFDLKGAVIGGSPEYNAMMLAVRAFPNITEATTDYDEYGSKYVRSIKIQFHNPALEKQRNQKAISHPRMKEFHELHPLQRLGFHIRGFLNHFSFNANTDGENAYGWAKQFGKNKEKYRLSQEQVAAQLGISTTPTSTPLMGNKEYDDLKDRFETAATRIYQAAPALKEKGFLVNPANDDDELYTKTMARFTRVIEGVDYALSLSREVMRPAPLMRASHPLTQLAGTFEKLALPHVKGGEIIASLEERFDTAINDLAYSLLESLDETTESAELDLSVAKLEQEANENQRMIDAANKARNEPAQRPT